MECFIFFMGGVIGGTLGSLLIMNILSSKDKHEPNETKIKPNEFQKKASKELDEMLNKFKKQ
jgi:hypothetical protein